MKHPFSMSVNNVQAVALSAEETEAVGGGNADGPMMATTMAVGEEGGTRPIRPIKPPVYTTLAIGEEGGSGTTLL